MANNMAADTLRLVNFDPTKSPLYIVNTERGPGATFECTWSNYIEFQRTNFAAKGAIGALGSFEMNMSVNMDYKTSLHRFYDNTQDAYWTALNTAGYYLQFAPKFAGDGDVWDNTGNQYGFKINVDEAQFNGHLVPIDDDKVGLGKSTRRYAGLFLSEKAANKVVIPAGQLSVWVDNVGCRPDSHIFTNVPSGVFVNSRAVPAVHGFTVQIESAQDTPTSVSFFMLG